VAKEDQLMTPADAAPILGISPSMVRVLERRGRLPALRTVSGTRLFWRRDVEALAAERLKPGGRRLPPPAKPRAKAKKGRGGANVSR